jgi:hypothetical protein
MSIQFEIGDPASPRGHALVYFKDYSDATKVGATYIVILPVSVDIAKYVPPFLAGQIDSFGGSDMSAFSFPPAPEPVNSEAEIKALARSRGDDLIFGGTYRLDDTANLMGLVGSITAEYRKLYDSRAEPLKSGDLSALEEPSGDEGEAEDEAFMYGLMSEADLLGELTTLMGRLRFAIEGGDDSGAGETETRMRAAGKHIPKNRRIDLLVDAAAGRGPNADELARLYMERAYGLFREDYRKVKAVEDRIKELTGGELSAGGGVSDG